MNVSAYENFRHDKESAIAGGQRVSERFLLTTAFLGGAVGAKLGQHRFRHKTRKEPFRTLLNAALVANAVTLTAFAVPQSRAAITTAFAATASAVAAGRAAVDSMSGEAEEPSFPRRFGPGSRD